MKVSNGHVTPFVLSWTLMWLFFLLQVLCLDHTWFMLLKLQGVATPVPQCCCAPFKVLHRGNVSLDSSPQ